MGVLLDLFDEAECFEMGENGLNGLNMLIPSQGNSGFWDLVESRIRRHDLVHIPNFKVGLRKLNDKKTRLQLLSDMASGRLRQLLGGHEAENHSTSKKTSSGAPT